MGTATGPLIWQMVFEFPSDDGYAESVIWRRYSAAIGEVHGVGCEKQRTDRGTGKPTKYIGAIFARSR